MKRTLKIAVGFSLPLDWILMSTVVYGGKGAGKTTLGAVVAEEVHKAKQRFCAIDLKGDFWGLKSAADGRSEGIPVVVFGGDHADLPLEPDAGKFMGELVPKLKQSAVLDLERMSKSQQVRFLGAFFDSLYFNNREPLLVIADEVQVYSPQKTFTPEAHATLGAFEHLVKLGRKHGLGVLAITQRGANLNKDVSELCETMVAFRTPGSLDQERVRVWLAASGHSMPVKAMSGDEADGRTVPLVASFKDGEALFASAHPSLKFFETIHVRRRETFDSSATPEFGAKRRRQPKMLAQPQLEAIKQQMADAIARHKENDPVELKKRIRELEAERAKVMKAVDGELVKLELLKKAKAPLDERSLKRLEKAIDKLVAAAGQLETLRGRMAQAERAVAAEIASLRGIADNLVSKLLKPGVNGKVAVTGVRPAVLFRGEKLVTDDPFPPKTLPGVFKKNGARSSSAGLGKGEATILAACIQFTDGLRTEQIGVLTAYKATSRRTYLTKLAHEGYVENVGGGIYRVTDKGRAALPNAQPLPTGDALREYWLANLPEGERVILDCLLKAYPQEVARETIDEATGYKATSRRTYLTKLAARELITQTSKGATASEGLFS